MHRGNYLQIQKRSETQDLKNIIIEHFSTPGFRITADHKLKETWFN